MKKRLLIMLVCLLLVAAFAACDMQFGGLVGELLGGGTSMTDDDNVNLLPPVQGEIETMPGSPTYPPETTPWGEETWPVETDPPIEYPDVTTEGGYDDPIKDLPADLFAGETVTVLGYQNLDLGLQEINNSDFVAQATLERNMLIAQVYGIELELLYADDVLQLNDLVKRDVQAGEGDFSIVYQQMARAAGDLAANGYLVSLHELPYMSLSAEWWDPFCDEAYGVGGYLPMASGAVTPDAILKTTLIVYNPDNATGLEDLTHFARKGSWHYTNVAEASNYVARDLNGDGVFTEDQDLFGFAGVTHETDQSFAVSTGAVIVRKDRDNLPVYAEENVERINEVYQSIYELCYNTPSIHVSMSDLASDPDAMEMPAKAFVEGRVLLYGTTLQGAIELAASGTTMGILPYPKYSENDPAYCSPVLTTASVVMVPQSARNLALTGYVLEGMARTSQEIYGAAIEAALLRGLTDQRGVEMLKLILQTRTVDFGSVYFYMDASNSAAVRVFETGLNQQRGSISSTIKQNERMLTKAIDKLIDQFSKG